MDRYIASPDELILVTGAAGFIGSRVVAQLLARGFRNIRCFTRRFTGASRLTELRHCAENSANLEVITGNLLSREDCATAVKDVAVILHLAAGRGEKSIPNAFLNSVVTTRNLIEAAMHANHLVRFVNVSSFAVYSNTGKRKRNLLDEACPLEQHPEKRGDAYTFAKVKQEELVKEYGRRYGLPYVIVRPGYVYGPGNEGITARVGIATFGVFLHLGGGNTIPLTFVDNCADAIILAGLVRDIEGESFNVVDDDLPSSRWLLRQYKKQVRDFTSLYVPHFVSYALSRCWERYSYWSHGQLPPTFNRSDWYATWRRTTYSNAKLKRQLDWVPIVPTTEGLRRHFEACRQKVENA